MSTTIIAEQQEEGIHPTLPQLVHAASVIGGECTIIIPGGGGESEASEIVGVDRVLKFNGSCFSVFDSQSWSSALKGSVGGTVLLASTPRGRELGASLAAELGMSVVQDVTSISEGINVERPVFSGKAIEKVAISSPAVITIRPNSMDSAGNGGSAPVSTIDSGEDLRMAVEEAITKASEKIDVSEADIIISGGRGLGDISNFEKLEIPLSKESELKNGKKVKVAILDKDVAFELFRLNKGFKRKEWATMTEDEKRKCRFKSASVGIRRGKLVQCLVRISRNKAIGVVRPFRGSHIQLHKGIGLVTGLVDLEKDDYGTNDGQVNVDHLGEDPSDNRLQELRLKQLLKIWINSSSTWHSSTLI